MTLQGRSSPLLGGLLVALIGVRAAEAASLAGVYRCWSYNVSGGGGSCRFTPPLVLKADGSYEMSSEKGTYQVSNGKLLLSQSKLRGPGILDGQGHIVFQYVYKGWTHRVTYLISDATSASSQTRENSSASGSLPVDIRIRFPRSDHSIGWINTISLQHEGQTDHFDCLAHGDGKSYVDGYFRAVARGRYKVLVGSGFEMRQVGTINLNGPASVKKIAIDAEPRERANTNQRKNE